MMNLYPNHKILPYKIFTYSQIFYTVIILCVFPVKVIGQVPLNDLFPFGVSNGDSQAANTDDGSEGPINLKFPFPFFNDSYTKLYVNNNGAISFKRAISAYTPVCGALDRDSTMIAPFWSDVDIRNGGNIYFRESTNQTLIGKIENDIRKAFPGIWSLSLKWLFIATWDRVAFYRDTSCPKSYRQNTFQIILTTDGLYSFATFYYHNVTWTTGGASNGDCFGLGGTPAKAGFDVGDGKTFHQIPGSCTSKILNLVNESNINEPGKWIFRLDTHFESASACDDNKYKTEKLIVSPSFVSPIGREFISLHGPCLNDTTTNTTCQFYDPTGSFLIHNESAIIDPLKSLAYCQLPYFDTYGRHLLKLLVQFDQNEDVYSGYIYITEAKAEVELKFDISSPTVKMEWAPNNFPQGVTKLDVIILEHENETLVERTILQEIPNSGVYSGDMNLMESNSSLWAIRLTATQQSGRTRRGLSDILRAIGSMISRGVNSAKAGAKTMVSKGMCASLFADSHAQRCDDWYRNDKGVSPEGVEPCPRKLDQAEQDDRFSREDGFFSSLCDPNFFHPGGEHFFRQSVPSPTTGARQQCVYDKFGKLMVGGLGRSTIDAASGPLSHFKQDVRPYCDCCYLSNNCDKYFDRRPADDGSKYEPPKYARSVGDPHLTTFDSLSYMFNGAGEFWMVQSHNNISMSVQTRMEPLGSGSASICTAFVMDDGVTKIQVEVSGESSGVDILLNEELIPFPKDSSEHLQLLTKTASIIKSKYRTIVAFSSEFTFIFELSGRSLNLRASSGQINSKNVNGLLGYFDNDPRNDLLTPNGTVIPRESGSRVIHYDFGLKWMTTSDESLFTYGRGKNWSTYSKPNFQPWFEVASSNRNNVPADVTAACANSFECLFDWAHTGSLEFANQTRVATKAFNNSVTVMAKPVYMCSSISQFQNGWVNLTNYFVGSKVQFTCDQDYVLIGASNLTCQSNHEDESEPYWSAQIPACELPSLSTTPKNIFSMSTSTTTERIVDHGLTSTSGNYCQSIPASDSSYPARIYVREGCSFSLKCDTHFLSRTSFYVDRMIKWNKDNGVFAAHSRDGRTNDWKWRTYPVPGVHLSTQDSTDSSIVLVNASRNSSGTYECEAVADASEFKLLRTKHMVTVLGRHEAISQVNATTDDDKDNSDKVLQQQLLTFDEALKNISDIAQKRIDDFLKKVSNLQTELNSSIDQVPVTQSTPTTGNTRVYSTTKSPKNEKNNSCIARGEYCGLGINCCRGGCFFFYCRDF